MERIEDLVELRNFLNSKTDAELEKMSFEFESFYWDNHWLRYESEDQVISQKSTKEDAGRVIRIPMDNVKHIKSY